MTAPICRACSSDAVVQWQRRPTDDEWVEVVEQSAGLVSDRSGVTMAVFACAVHAIPLESAAHIHGPSCAAPPACNCAPEEIPQGDFPQGNSQGDMPPGWVANA